MTPPAPARTPALEILRRRARALAGEIVQAARPGCVQAVFVGGSVARGEVWSAAVADRIEIYSDIDLYVVVDSSASARDLRPRVAALIAAQPRELDGAELVRSPDVGVYTVEDLLSQPVRPGTMDLAQHALWLHGDRGMLSSLSSAMARPMEPREALYLIENRVAELAAAGRETAVARRRLAATVALKARLDVGAAHLIARGAYRSTLAERMQAIRQEFASSEFRAEVEAAFAEYQRLDAYLSAARVPEVCESAARSAAGAWLAIAPAVLEGGPGSATDLVERRCRRSRFRENHREFVRVRRRQGASRARAAYAGLHAAGFSPVTAIRLHALAAVIEQILPEEREPLRRLARYVDRATRAMGYTTGSLDARSAAARSIL